MELSGVIRRGGIPVTLAALALLVCLAPAARGDIAYAPVMIYYDQVNPTDNDGKIRVNALRNLLGHFKATVDYTNLTSYTAGQLTRYKAVFYIGSEYTNIPAAFNNDVLASTNTIVWMGYNIWSLTGVTSGTNRFGIHYDYYNVSNGYTTVHYKGVDLVKTSDLVQIAVNTNLVTTLATATNTTNHLSWPYAVHSSNLWYIADNPLASQQLGDRSLVLADLLHDILGSGTNFSRRGLVRIEDIAPELTDTGLVAACSTALHGLGVNATFGIIPRYRDPLGKYTNSYPADMPMSQNRAFLRVLSGVLRDGGEFADHGYTHESGDAESGSGYEFWSATNNAPLPYDSWEWCAGRVTNGLTELLTSSFPVTCWETVHYEAALDDYPAFSETYRYSHERARVFAAFTDGVSKSNLDAVSSTNPHYGDQWFPYVIQKSCYGNTFIPENIDRFSTTPGLVDGNGQALSITNKILYSQRLSVVRDAVVGFYYHPQYGATNLTNIVQQIASLGYTFVSPLTLSRDEPVALYTNVSWAASNTVRSFTVATNLNADLVVGDAGGNNQVKITNGVAVANEEALLGLQAGASSNSVYVSGPGSTWTSRRILSVGRHGPANSATVGNGGSVLAPETVLGLYPESFGNSAGITASSAWSNRYGYTVGYGSASNGMTVSSGGLVADQYGEIGATTSAYKNSVFVSDPGSLWSNSQYVVVGNAGAANTLTIQSSGVVSSAFGLIGARSTAASNAVQVTGPGSCWTNTASLTVGIDAGRNSLMVSNGATVACASAVVGDFANGVGNRIDVQAGNATLLVQQDLTVGADGSSNVVHVGPGGVVRCGSITVGRDLPGPGNEFIVDGGAVMTTGAVQVLVGRLTLTNGTLQAGSVVVADQGEADIGNGFQFTGTVLTNRGLVVIATGATLQASVVLSGNGRLDTGTGGTIRVAGDFLSSATNSAWSLATATLAFSTSATHRLSLNAADRGAHLNGFDANPTLGGLVVEGDVTVTNVCYIWSLGGAGTLRISPGARVYYVTLAGWSGSVVTSDGLFQQVPVSLNTITPSTGTAVRLSWTAASGLTFDVEWADRLLPAPTFSNATRILSATTNQVWIDTGSTNRPAPALSTQRFYRLGASR